MLTMFVYMFSYARALSNWDSVYSFVFWQKTILKFWKLQILLQNMWYVILLRKVVNLVLITSTILYVKKKKTIRI